MVKMYRKLILESGADDKYVDSTIAGRFPQLQPYLNTPLSELHGIGLGIPDTDLQRYGNTRLKDYMRQSLMREFDISHGRGPARFLRGIARVAVGELGWPEGNRGDLSKFKQYVLYIYNNEPEKFDKNLNNLTFGDLSGIFKQKTKDAQRLDVERLGRENLGKSSYRVVPIRSVEEAMRYGGYTSWCITQRSYGESNYNNYTQGGGRFYFLLKEGFEKVPKQVGENCPLDEYGLSMISVLVGIDGNIEIITTRWNHEHDGENNPNLHTAEQLQHITGIRVYEVLKPYSREELHQMGIVLFDEVQDLLDSGKSPEDVFDWVNDFYNGYALVRLNWKFNFINTKGKILCDQWYVDAGDFSEGYAPVRLNGKYNFIDTEAKIQFDQWFDWVRGFSDGYALVRLNWKFNFINTKGKILCDQWYDGAGEFHDGYARVRLNRKWNFIDTKGNILSQQWFELTGDFREGYAEVKLNGEWKYLDTKGNLYDYDPRQQSNVLTEAKLRKIIRNVLQEMLV